jgi:hypothetical protein
MRLFSLGQQAFRSAQDDNALLHVLDALHPE